MAGGAAAQSSWLVFSGTAPGVTVTQLFRIQTSGEGLEQITNGYLPALAPAFSPNGKKIAFARTGSGLFVMNPDGSGLKRLTNNPRDTYPAWSPTGTQIAFVRPYNKFWRIFVMPATGGPQHRLAKAPPAGRPSWLKAGLLLPSGGDLLRIDPATGRPTKYYGVDIDVVYGLNSVAVAPNASSLTYVGTRTPDPGDQACGEGAPCQRFALFSEPIRKNARPKLVIKDGGPSAFSPDGKKIAFSSKNALVIKTLASGASTTVDTGDALPGIATPAAWQP